MLIFNGRSKKYLNEEKHENSLGEVENSKIKHSGNQEYFQSFNQWILANYKTKEKNPKFTRFKPRNEPFKRREGDQNEAYHPFYFPKVSSYPWEQFCVF